MLRTNKYKIILQNFSIKGSKFHNLQHDLHY